MTNDAGWVGGPKYIKLRRGSNIGRHGGTHSGGAGRKRNRFLPMLHKALAANAKARKRKG